MIRCNPLVFLIALVITAPLAAQRTDSDAREMARFPDPPANHIFDDAGLFQRHAERRAIISRRLATLQTEHDLPVYVAIFGAVLDSSLEHRARLLYDRWIGPDHEGIVVVYETDTLRREIATPGNHYAKLRSDAGTIPKLQDYRMIEILAELRVTLEGVEDRIDFIDRTVEILVNRIGALLEEEPPGREERSTLQFIAMILLVGVVITLLGLFANRRLRFVEERAREQFFFPEVMVGTRLGAPYAGGRQSVVEFSRNQAPPQ